MAGIIVSIAVIIFIVFLISKSKEVKEEMAANAAKVAENQRIRATLSCTGYTDEDGKNVLRHYNTVRLQRNLGILTPMEKHELFFLAA